MQPVEIQVHHRSSEQRQHLAYDQASDNRDPQRTAQFEVARKAFHALFDTAGVPVIDPTEALRTTPETVFIDYVHYTPDGNRFVASLIYKQLSEQLAARRAK